MYKYSKNVLKKEAHYFLFGKMVQMPYLDEHGPRFNILIVCINKYLARFSTYTNNGYRLFFVKMQQASNVLLSPVDLSANYVVQVYELTLVDPTYHFSTYEISADKRKISFSKKFPPNFQGYRCGTTVMDIELG